MVRGIEKRDIFIDDHDRSAFVDHLSTLLVKTKTDCLAWSLLSNHAHLLLCPTKGKLSELMRRLLTGHAVVFNHRHHRSGHLFQNRYKSIVCEEDSYLLELVRYIHLNPIRAGLVDSMETLDTFKWSGHSVILGDALLPGQAVDSVLQIFDGNKKRAVRKYRGFVTEGIVLWHETEQPQAPAASPLPLAEVIERVATVFGIDAIVLLRGSKEKCVSDARGAIGYIAIRKLGYHGVELTKSLGLSESGVVLAARRGEALFAAMPTLREIAAP